MNVGIVGAGSMGMIFSYFAVKASFNVSIYTNREETVAAMRYGLHVTIAGHIQNFKVRIDNNSTILAQSDIILFFVKSYSTEQAIKDIIGDIRSDCIIVSLQNGLGNAELVEKYISRDRIVYGSTSIGATKTGSNEVFLGGMGDVIIGGKNVTAVKKVETVLRQMNLNVIITPDPDKVIWQKLIINAGINPLGALLSIPNGQIIANEYTLLLQENLIREAVDVACALGFEFNTKEMIAQTIKVCEKTEKNNCSMLQDFLNHEKTSSIVRTEIDSINGKIVEYGKTKRINTPLNFILYRLIKAKEATAHL